MTCSQSVSVYDTSRPLGGHAHQVTSLMRVAYKLRTWFRTETKQNGIVPESDEGTVGVLRARGLNGH